MGHPRFVSLCAVAMLRGSLFARPLLEHTLYVASATHHFAALVHGRDKTIPPAESKHEASSRQSATTMT